ncbi:MAG: hypothetical protein C0622_00835 [Desulfuromonas sp.]|nr:MAG: hypothetical protein C0622_00835 [Desulfuromonas sp.]
MFGLQIINEMENFQRELDQLFRAGHSASVARRGVRFETKDQGENYLVRAALPGLDVAKLDISILGRRLSVSGEFVNPELPENAVWQRRERHSGAFEQQLLLGADLDSDKVEAEYRNGILEIKLPKAAAALPRKIAIKAV